MAFIEAVRGKNHVKAIITGGAGSGKTYTSYSLASHLVAKGDPELVREAPLLPGGYQFSRKLARKIAVIESENRSREYAGGRPFWYDVEELTSFGPSIWAQALTEARKRGYEAVILDSFSDEWRGRGGCLSLAEENKGSGIQAWKVVKEAHWRLIEAFQNYPGHILITARSKPGIDIEDQVDPRSGKIKKVPVARGLMPIQEEEFPYRLSFLFDMTSVPERGVVLKVRKSVADNLQNETEIEKPGKELADLLLSWCDSGASDLSLYQTIRERVIKAENKKDLKSVGLEIAASEELLTMREIETLREVYAIVKDELKKIEVKEVPKVEAAVNDSEGPLPADTMALG